MSLEQEELRMRQLQAAMRECDRLDLAAGEYTPPLTIGGWIAARMRQAVNRSAHNDRP